VPTSLPAGVALVAALIDHLGLDKPERYGGAPLLGQRLRVASLRCGLPDLAASLEIDPLAVVRKRSIAGPQQNALGVAARSRSHRVDLSPMIGAGIEDQQLPIWRPSQTADAGARKVSYLSTVAAIGVAHKNFIIAGLVGNVGDSFAVRRIGRGNLAAGGADYGPRVRGRIRRSR